MKKIIFLLIPIILLTGCSYNNPATQTKTNSQSEEQYVKAVWITYYELQGFIENNSESKFTDKISSVFSDLKDKGFNTVIVQVRPCADAFYRSKYFPSSKYCFGFQGADMAYDPLEIMCSQAKDKGLVIEAWINPYRVSQNNKISELCDDNIAKKWYKSKDKKSYVYVSDSSIYFNPAADEVKNLIINGVKEIVLNYSVNAIHFDDYFYPAKDKKIDSVQYKKYKQGGGDESLADWRRDNVNDMVSRVYKAIKSINKNVLFGISPASDIENDYSALYADVEKWCTNEGYIDYICPQIYFGFKNEKQPFMQTAKKWVSLSEKTIYVGLGLYKCSKADKYASASDKTAINEFKKNHNIISRQITYLGKIDEVKGFYIFSYSNLYDKDKAQEVENLLSAMQSSSQN